MADLLSQEAVAEKLEALPGWGLDDGKLHRSFRFADFRRAFAFMTGAALAAERLNHHPEWFNVWSKVDVHLNTHEAGGITDLDFQLAQAMNNLADAL
ncbi:MAG: 4a-hydroxytetrahydrobiopterin dehydratase [Gammaproteobacteria bacterium]|nr:4a-hydroxytetrahydrobiopterin dehydratase [Gammaproteobacteria bacterium]